ncbi:MAG: protein kinase, partial [Planctomycetaceae bacterium]|nr:protein kinase [Planctomycetaceae bacterium]
MTVSVDQFGKAAVTSGLMSPTELKALWAEIPADKKPPDGPSFANILRQRGLLNDFQSDELLSGRDTPLVLNQYVLVSKIGAGGMGQVFKAQHRKMKRLVAIKLLPSSMTKDEAAIKRFQREVEAAAKLTHPNIVAALDADECRGMHYLVMEYVEGQDLSAVVKKQGPLAVAQAIDYILQAARGLAYAHAEGVVHRDIKPANLLVDKKGVVKILDMGLARIDGMGDAADHQLTNTGQVMGTVDYMAPEQATDTRMADARSDVYSLGCSLYRLLTGGNVYDGDTLIKKIMSHMHDAIPSLRTKRPDVPAELDRIFAKMMAKKPTDRYQQTSQLVTELEALRSPGGAPSQPSVAEQDSELQRFLSGVKDSKTNPGTATKLAVTPASQTNVDEATAAFSSSDATTDPKSEVIAAGAVAAAATPQKAATAGRATRTKASKSQQLPIKWIAAGALGVVLVLLGIVVVVRDKDGNKVAEVNVPPGGTVEVKQTPSVTPTKSATPAPSVSPSATKSATPAPSSFSGGNTSASITPPAGDYGLQLTDRNTKVEAPNPGLDITRPVTVEAYLTLGDLPANGISGPLQLVSINDEFGIQIRNSQWVFFSKHNQVTAPSPLTPNRRIHFAGVRTSTQRKLYLDGKLAASMDEPLTKTPNAQRNVLSIDSGLGVSFTIDALRITQGTMYLQDFTPPQRFAADKETRLLYQFDEGQGDTVQDSSGNGYHGKISGAKWVRADGSPINDAGSFFGASSSAVQPFATPTSPRWPFDPADGQEYVWSTPENLGPSVNTARNEFVAGISADENVLYFYNLNDEPIAFAKRTDATQPFGPAFTVPILGNNLGAGISSDQLSAVFARKSSNGESEFWLSSRPNAAAAFGEPVRATEPVNVNGKVHQSQPVLSPDGLTLLLCSARQPSQRADIWMFTRTAIAEQFTTAERLAEPISTPAWDMPYFISNDRCFMIASSQRVQGTADDTERRRVRYFTRSKPTDPFEPGLPLDMPLGAQQENVSNDGFRLTGDGRAIYFGSGSLPGGHGVHDIWVTRRVPKATTSSTAAKTSAEMFGTGATSFTTTRVDIAWPFDPKDGQEYVWSAPENLGPRVNDLDTQHKPTVTADQLVLIVNHTSATAGESDLIEYRRKRIDEPWSDGVRLTGSDVEQFPSLGADGLTLIYSAFDPKATGAQGKQDLYLRQRDKLDAPWGPPQNLGQQINSAEDEQGVNLSPDGLALVFSSNRAGGKGGFDLYIARRKQMNDPWGAPQNMGSVLNDDAPQEFARFVGDSEHLLFNRGGDIKLAELDKGGNWSLLPRPDYVHNPKSAWPTPDGRTLYFHSEAIPATLGKADIWVIRRVPKSATNAPAAPANVVYLDDLPELEFRVWGDRGLGKHGKYRDQGKDEQTIQWRGKPVTHALWMHPTWPKDGGAFVRYQLDGKYLTFAAEAGIPATTSKDPLSPVHFRVLGDGRELWKSPPLKTRGESAEVSVDVSGVKELRLETSCEENNGNCHTTWFMPRLTPLGTGTQAAAAAPRWPLEPSKPDDIVWLQGLNATLTLRSGPNAETTLKPTDAPPKNPATIVGLAIHRENGA